MKKILFFLIFIFTLNCSVTSIAEVVENLNCSLDSNSTLDFTVPIYSEPDSSSEIVERLYPRSQVQVFNHRTHNIFKLKDFIEVKTEKSEGWISTDCVIVGQSPDNSVFYTAYKEDYKYFYDPNDKNHYPNGYEREENKGLSKESIPLSELLKD